MADNERSRDGQTNGEEQRPPEREREEVRNRTTEDQHKHGDPSEQLGDLDDALETHDYPTTTNELVETYGDYEIQTQSGEKSLEDVLAVTKNQTYDSADDVRSRILGLIHR